MTTTNRSLGRKFSPQWLLPVLWVLVSSCHQANEQELRPLQQANVEEKKSLTLEQTSDILAGVQVSSPLAYHLYDSTTVWQKHFSFSEKSFKMLESRSLRSIRKYSDVELSSANSGTWTVFYPFSGPDFLYVYNFFPKGKNYLLMGLEPIGSLPDLKNLPQPALENYLVDLRNSLFNILNLSFFRTKGLEEDLKGEELNGILPILAVMLARTNNQVLNISTVRINPQGQGQETPFSTDISSAEIAGVKIEFHSRSGGSPQALYYFPVDLSDASLDKKKEFLGFLKDFGPKNTFIKAASYLMHYPNFSLIRKFVLNQSRIVLQDDSGVPFKYLKPEEWNFTCYGTYEKPIKLFDVRFQPELKGEYDKEKPKRLDFGIGYSFRKNTSNLLLAVRK